MAALITHGEYYKTNIYLGSFWFDGRYVLTSSLKYYVCVTNEIRLSFIQKCLAVTSSARLFRRRSLYLGFVMKLLKRGIRYQEKCIQFNCLCKKNFFVPKKFVTFVWLQLLWARIIPRLFLLIFGLFKEKIEFWQQINVKNVHRVRS